jgi:hypothetical protein
MPTSRAKTWLKRAALPAGIVCLTALLYWSIFQIAYQLVIR